MINLKCSGYIIEHSMIRSRDWPKIIPLALCTDCRY